MIVPPDGTLSVMMPGACSRSPENELALPVMLRPAIIELPAPLPAMTPAALMNRSRTANSLK